ncbi:MAG: bifunctional folylpolyglutamate synthase/dihydrofolate synthase [Chloroflexi bacterium HGW-Chloroflexi-2]|jgi:dihydrofolate synthase/folylpolyglutamate synthase|nr:MAG: bifunctional folylpolyglutamate synthase/dihydrofolate synthase [Chloroflexi bacterium HGW-Chloroflexi-2]
MDIETKYQEALDYLYTFIDYSMTRNMRYTEDKFNLDRMHKFMELFDNPHKKYPVIHVAGTKGKGSTSALIAHALYEQGYKVGFYTSPHLHDFCERIQVDFVPMKHEEMVAIVDLMKSKIPFVAEITTFELMTAMAFIYFMNKHVDYAVIEVGLGGRLDATNVVSPLVSVITSLSLDHINVLGDTLAKIAYEKGGIIKNNTPVVVAPQKDEAILVLKKIAEERNSPLFQVGKDYLYAQAAKSLSGQNFFVWPKEDQIAVNAFIESAGREDWEPTKFHIPLLGFHQVQNAATAFTTLTVLRQNGLKISDDSIRKGFANVVWPGRFEVINRRPFIVIDSAHNRESALRLRNAVDDYFPGIPVVLVFGASEDKDIDGMLVELLPRVKIVITTKSIHPRAISPEDLVIKVNQMGVRAIPTQSLEEAFDQALKLAGKENLILVAGSIFVAGGMRDVWFDLQKIEMKGNQ